MSLIHIPERNDLTGKIVSLNLQVCKRFQCGGFALGPNRPFAVVEPGCQQDLIRQGLLDGRLVDITNQNIDGIQIAGSAHSPAKVLDEKGKKVYLQVNHDGSLTVIAPKDDADEARREAELATNGTLIINEEEIKVSEQPFTQDGRIDAAGAEEVITNMANTIERARIKYSPQNSKKVN